MTIDAQAAEIEALRIQVDGYDGTIAKRDLEIERLRAALTAIEQWDVPMVESRGEAVSMGVAYGSNGVRDYFREVARAALSGESKS